ncbi:Blp family class II bacteriocin [Neisseria mucosa]|uniref:Blp family class II bacteriocin n=1 Tax=Neisseria mucosa TaxID=488 RepID=UPI00280AD3DD|nr:Blp family class II bacteriocin [Neisseria mucosa]
MQAFYADKTEIRTLSMDELSLVAGGFNWDKVQWGKAVAVGAVTGLSAGVAGLAGETGVAAAAAAGGFVGDFGSTVVSDGWE